MEGVDKLELSIVAQPSRQPHRARRHLDRRTAAACRPTVQRQLLLAHGDTARCSGRQR